MSSSPVETATISPTITRPTSGALPASGGRLAVEGGHHEEVAAVEGARAEGRPGEHEQHVAGAQAHLAELAGDALVGPVDRDHGAAVAAAEARLLERAAHQRATPGATTAS